MPRADDLLPDVVEAHDRVFQVLEAVKPQDRPGHHPDAHARRAPALLRDGVHRHDSCPWEKDRAPLGVKAQAVVGGVEAAGAVEDSGLHFANLPHGIEGGKPLRAALGGAKSRNRNAEQHVGAIVVPAATDGRHRAGTPPSFHEGGPNPLRGGGGDCVRGSFRRGKFRGGVRHPWELPSSNTCTKLPTALTFARGKFRHLPQKRNFPTTLSPHAAPPPPSVPIP